MSDSFVHVGSKTIMEVLISLERTVNRLAKNISEQATFELLPKDTLVTTNLRITVYMDACCRLSLTPNLMGFYRSKSGVNTMIFFIHA
jgi:hypothetical protein